MAITDDFLALQRFTKPIIGYGVADAVARSAQASALLAHHAEITGTMNVDPKAPDDVVDALLAIAEGANSGSGADVCLTASIYDQVADADPTTWGSVDHSQIHDVWDWASAMAAKVAATSRIVGYGGNPPTAVYGPLSVAWVVLDCRAYALDPTDGSALSPQAKAARQRAIALKLDVASSIVRQFFPDARVVYWRNGEVLPTEGENLSGAFLGYADARLVEWFALHDPARTIRRLELNRQKLGNRAPGADRWGVALSLGGGIDRATGSFAFDYDPGRSGYYRAGMRIANDDAIAFVYEFPGPLDQRVGSDRYMAAMVDFASGWHGDP